MSEYLDEFVQESEESITELNNALLELERDPDDVAVDDVFRTAHTLKGNFAAMGFDAASDLAHAIEDLLDAIRDGQLAVSPDIMDLLFAGVDQLEQALDNIDDQGAPQITPDQTITQLRAPLGEESAASTAVSGDDPDTASSLAATVAADAVSERAIALSITIDPGELKGVDAMLVLEALEDHLSLLATDPERASLENGDFAESFEVLVDAPDVSTATEVASDPGPVSAVDADDITDTLETGSPASSDTADDSGSIETDAVVDEIETVRIDVEQLDRLYRLVEQFVTGHVRLERGIENGDPENLRENIDELGKTTETLQDTVIDMRLVPFETIVGKFPRLVRDLAREQDKQIDFQITGRDVEIDRSILTELGDPLSHILRNAVDHGIEPPEERTQQGKPPQGTIELRAQRKRDQVIIEVEDDGRGLDDEAIRETALEQGLRTPEELDHLSESELYDLVFHPGFSTADEVTDVSGRGVGMDVVHETITRLDGSINVESTPGGGTTVTLRLPVTMAIVQVLILQVGDEEYGIPIKHVDEILPREAAITLDGDPVVEYGDDIYPVIELADRFAVPEADTNGAGNLIRVDPDERCIAIGCDRVRAQQTVVVKPLEGMLGGTPGLSGTAILGDGDIMYLLDIATL